MLAGSPGVSLGARYLLKRALIESRVFLRNAPSAVFGIALPLVYEVIVLSAFRGSHFSNGVPVVPYYVPATASFAVLSTTFTNLAMTIAIRKDAGLIKVAALSPAGASVYVIALALSACAMSLVVLILCVALGVAGFGFSLASLSLGRLLLAWLFAVFCLCSLGMALGALIPNAQAASAIVNLVALPLSFLSGLFFSLGNGLLSRVISYLPVKAAFSEFLYSLSGLKSIYPHDLLRDILVLFLWGVLGVFVSAWSLKKVTT